MQVVVTGSSGFIGRYLCQQLSLRGYFPRRIFRVRPADNQFAESMGLNFVVGEINETTNWITAIQGSHCIIHCASRAHVFSETEIDVLQAYRRVNVLGTIRLAEQAVIAGVPRLIYISSIKVNGESTENGKLFTSSSESRFSKIKYPPSSRDAYGYSKWEAEEALKEIAARTGLELVIIRPPLVYGPGAKGNLLKLMGLVSTEIPMPLGSISNKRSMIGLRNLTDLLINCVDHPQAKGRTFLVADGEDFSTPDLVRHICLAMGFSPRLFPFPPFLLRLIGRVLGRGLEINRLLDSLQVDASDAAKYLNWRPSTKVESEIQDMINFYRSSR